MDERVVVGEAVSVEQAQPRGSGVCQTGARLGLCGERGGGAVFAFEQTDAANHGASAAGAAGALPLLLCHCNERAKSKAGGIGVHAPALCDIRQAARARKASEATACHRHRVPTCARARCPRQLHGAGGAVQHVPRTPLSYNLHRGTRPSSLWLRRCASPSTLRALSKWQTRIPFPAFCALCTAPSAAPTSWTCELCHKRVRVLSEARACTDVDVLSGTRKGTGFGGVRWHRPTTFRLCGASFEVINHFFEIKILILKSES